MFKNQKSNGFRLESTKMKKAQSFKTMFGLMCVAMLWLTILGAEYTAKEGKDRNYIKIKFYKKKDKENRIISLKCRVIRNYVDLLTVFFIFDKMLI